MRFCNEGCLRPIRNCGQVKPVAAPSARKRRIENGAEVWNCPAEELFGFSNYKDIGKGHRHRLWWVIMLY